MPNRNLKPDELDKANNLLAEIRAHLDVLAQGDRELLFAYRRKIVKELGYDERSKPGNRNKLKVLKLRQQGGKCPECGETLPNKYTVLDRRNAVDGYTSENTELIHMECDYRRQAAKGYK